MSFVKSTMQPVLTPKNVCVSEVSMKLWQLPPPPITTFGSEVVSEVGNAVVAATRRTKAGRTKRMIFMRTPLAGEVCIR